METDSNSSLSSFRRPSQLDPHHTRSVLKRALDVWEQASRLTFKEINSDEADIVVSFAKRYHDDAYPFDGRGSILAHAFFPGSGKGGDAHFDDDELWLLQPMNDEEEGTSLFAVAAHEFGHSLGLSHSSAKGALMFPWYQGFQPNFVLPEDDRNGIQQMYGPKENRKLWGIIPSYKPDTPPPPTTTSTTTTTRKPPYVHHRRHHNHPPGYTPYPRDPSKYPVFYPERPKEPERPSHPEQPTYPKERPNWPDRPQTRYPRPTYPDRPERRHYNTTHTTHTTRPPTHRPHYPSVTTEYPNYRPHNPKEKGHEHPKRPYSERPTTVRPTPPSDKPDTCDTSYDAVALIRGELFIFKNRYHWRIGKNGRYPGYPIEITRMWPQLPKDLTHVDAVYERPDKKIAFFVGKQLFLFDSQYLARGYPKPLTALGLPESVARVDASMVWGHNGKTYLYSGTMYWKYDEYGGKVEPDYPRDMAMWKGVGYNIDSVFQWKDGKTYFFKGKGFWKFNDLQMRVEHERQMPSAPFWMGCPSEPSGRRAPYRAPQAPGSTLRSPSSAATTRLINNTSLLTSVLLVLISYMRYS
ncbi:hypothetical protein O0L34_g6131 [Tuta absoluta]|nr:hypothetical protein O0L34_g6131 [Tuta absoluta]